MKAQLKELEERENNKINNINNSVEKSQDNEILNQTLNLEATMMENKHREDKKMKLDEYLDRNAEILHTKLIEEEKKMKDKYKKLKKLESFENPIMLALESKFKDYKFNQMNSKISNQEVFFNTSRNESVGTIVKLIIKLEKYEKILS